MAASYEPGKDANGRDCFYILDGSRKRTGQYCYSEQKAQQMTPRQAAVPTAAPVAPKPVRPPKVLKAPNACPICGMTMRQGETQKVPNGRWVHRGCVAAETANVNARDAAAVRAAEEKGWFTLQGIKSEHLTKPWAPGQISQIDGTGYTEQDVARLLARTDQEAFRIQQRLLKRMWDRQTADEQAAGDARHRNMQGFSKPDATRAKDILALINTAGYSPALHFRLASLLHRYAGTQLLQIMNEGAARTGKILRTNPRNRHQNI